MFAIVYPDHESVACRKLHEGPGRGGTADRNVSELTETWPVAHAGRREDYENLPMSSCDLMKLSWCLPWTGWVFCPLQSGAVWQLRFSAAPSQMYSVAQICLALRPWDVDTGTAALQCC